MISEHALRVYVALRRSSGNWRTANEIASAADVASRTARAHLTKLVKLGVAQVSHVWPLHYRLVANLTGPAAEFVKQLEFAAEVFERSA